MRAPTHIKNAQLTVGLMNSDNGILINQLGLAMQTVFIVMTPMKHILGVFSTLEVAQAVRQAIGDDCIICEEIVQTA